MPRPRAVEKSKDFKGSMKRLIKGLNKWKIIMLIALMLGFASAIISLVTPDKVSKLTDTISSSLSFDEKVMQELITKIKTNQNMEDIRIKDTIITYSERLELITFMNNVDFKDTSQIVNKIDNNY